MTIHIDGIAVALRFMKASKWSYSYSVGRDDKGSIGACGMGYTRLSEAIEAGVLGAARHIGMKANPRANGAVL